MKSTQSSPQSDTSIIEMFHPVPGTPCTEVTQSQYYDLYSSETDRCKHHVFSGSEEKQNISNTFARTPFECSKQQVTSVKSIRDRIMRKINATSRESGLGNNTKIEADILTHNVQPLHNSTMLGLKKRLEFTTAKANMNVHTFSDAMQSSGDLFQSRAGTYSNHPQLVYGHVPTVVALDTPNENQVFYGKSEFLFQQPLSSMTYGRRTKQLTARTNGPTKGHYIDNTPVFNFVSANTIIPKCREVSEIEWRKAASSHTIKMENNVQKFNATETNANRLQCRRTLDLSRIWNRPQSIQKIVKENDESSPQIPHSKLAEWAQEIQRKSAPALQLLADKSIVPTPVSKTLPPEKRKAKMSRVKSVKTSTIQKSELFPIKQKTSFRSKKLTEPQKNKECSLNCNIDDDNHSEKEIENVSKANDNSLGIQIASVYSLNAMEKIHFEGEVPDQTTPDQTNTCRDNLVTFPRNSSVQKPNRLYADDNDGSESSNNILLRKREFTMSKVEMSNNVHAKRSRIKYGNERGSRSDSSGSREGRILSEQRLHFNDVKMSVPSIKESKSKLLEKCTSTPRTQIADNVPEHLACSVTGGSKFVQTLPKIELNVVSRCNNMSTKVSFAFSAKGNIGRCQDSTVCHHVDKALQKYLSDISKTSACTDYSSRATPKASSGEVNVKKDEAAGETICFADQHRKSNCDISEDMHFNTNGHSQRYYIQLLNCLKNKTACDKMSKLIRNSHLGSNVLEQVKTSDQTALVEENAAAEKISTPLVSLMMPNVDFGIVRDIENAESGNNATCTSSVENPVINGTSVSSVIFHVACTLHQNYVAAQKDSTEFPRSERNERFVKILPKPCLDKVLHKVTRSKSNIKSKILKQRKGKKSTKRQREIGDAFLHQIPIMPDENVKHNVCPKSRDKDMSDVGGHSSVDDNNIKRTGPSSGSEKQTCAVSSTMQMLSINNNVVNACSDKQSEINLRGNSLSDSMNAVADTRKLVSDSNNVTVVRFSDATQDYAKCNDFSSNKREHVTKLTSEFECMQQLYKWNDTLLPWTKSENLGDTTYLTSSCPLNMHTRQLKLEPEDIKLNRSHLKNKRVEEEQILDVSWIKTEPNDNINKPAEVHDVLSKTSTVRRHQGEKSMPNDVMFETNRMSKRFRMAHHAHSRYSTNYSNQCGIDQLLPSRSCVDSQETTSTSKKKPSNNRMGGSFIELPGTSDDNQNLIKVQCDMKHTNDVSRRYPATSALPTNPSSVRPQLSVSSHSIYSSIGIGVHHPYLLLQNHESTGRRLFYNRMGLLPLNSYRFENSCAAVTHTTQAMTKPVLSTSAEGPPVPVRLSSQVKQLPFVAPVKHTSTSAEGPPVRLSSQVKQLPSVAPVKHTSPSAEGPPVPVRLSSQVKQLPSVAPVKHTSTSAEGPPVRLSSQVKQLPSVAPVKHTPVTITNAVPQVSQDHSRTAIVVNKLTALHINMTKIKRLVSKLENSSCCKSDITQHKIKILKQLFEMKSRIAKKLMARLRECGMIINGQLQG